MCKANETYFKIARNIQGVAENFDVVKLNSLNWKTLYVITFLDGSFVHKKMGPKI